MTDKEKEFEYHVEGIMDYLFEGIMGTDPLYYELGNEWADIIKEAVERLMETQKETFEEYKEHFDLGDY